MMVYLEFDMTEEAYAAFRGDGPVLLTDLGGVAVGMLKTFPDLCSVEYAEGYANQTQEWIDTYKNKYDHCVLASAQFFTQAEFETYHHFKALPVFEYAFHLDKPEASLITFGVIECTTP